MIHGIRAWTVIRRFIDTMMNQTTSFTLPLVRRSSVMPKAVLLQLAPIIIKDPAALPKIWICDRLAWSIAKTLRPKPNEMLTVKQAVPATYTS